MKVFLVLVALSWATSSFSQKMKKNIVLILCDDLGYGDAGCYGNQLNRTPNIDKLADAGVKFTDFYSASGLCTPSRAALMTGCYPLRIGMDLNFRGECVCFPVDEKGLNPEEITIAELFKQKDYKTALIGKWHLGDQMDFLPTEQGFDYFYGLPYSNDTPPEYELRGSKKLYEHPEIPLLRNRKVIEAPVNQKTLTKRYTEEAVSFIFNNQDEPFLLIVSHTMPHSPLFASDRFNGKSNNGLLGDVVEEIDWSVGEIMKTLKQTGIQENTIVVFTSDNGAGRHPKERSNLPLSGYKGSVMEGGMRVPMIVSCPGLIPEGKVCNQVSTIMDFYPTFGNLIGSDLPDDRVIDGKDIWSLITNPENSKTPYTFFAYYVHNQLQAIRVDNWKLHLPLMEKQLFCSNKTIESNAILFNLKDDPGEKNNLAELYPDTVSRLIVFSTIARNWIGDCDKIAPNTRSAGYVSNPIPLTKNQE